MKDELNGKTYVVYEHAAERMFHWLTPYIEKAGYIWTTKTHLDSMGNQTSAMEITIHKPSLDNK